MKAVFFNNKNHNQSHSFGNNRQPPRLATVTQTGTIIIRKGKKQSMRKRRKMIVSLVLASVLAAAAGCAKKEPAPVKSASDIASYVSSGEWKGETVTESYGSYIVPANWMKYDSNATSKSWSPDFVRNDPTNVMVTALEDPFGENDFDSFAETQARVFREKMAQSGLVPEEERFTTASGLECVCLSVNEKATDSEEAGANAVLHDSVSRLWHVHGDKRYALFVETVFDLDHLEEIDALTRAMVDSFSFSAVEQAS